MKTFENNHKPKSSHRTAYTESIFHTHIISSSHHFHTMDVLTVDDIYRNYHFVKSTCFGQEQEPYSKLDVSNYQNLIIGAVCRNPNLFSNYTDYFDIFKIIFSAKK